MMKCTILNLGTLKVNACEMIMGLEEELIKKEYRVEDDGSMRIGMKGMIVETGGKVIVFDPGTATFLSKSLAEEYQLDMERSLEEEVKVAGYSMEDVTDVVFTHLHFDHGSGAFLRIQGGIIKAFPNARYVVSSKQINEIGKLEKGESGEFFHKLLRFAGELTWMEEWKADGIRFEVSHGHTPHMMVPVMDLGDRDLIYATDLVPMRLHNKPEAWSYYDKDKNLLQEERQRILGGLRPGSEIIFYHEP